MALIRTFDQNAPRDAEITIKVTSEFKEWVEAQEFEDPVLLVSDEEVYNRKSCYVSFFWKDKKYHESTIKNEIPF